MTEKSSNKLNSLSQRVRSLLRSVNTRDNLLLDLTLPQLLIGIGFVLLFSFLLLGYEFGTIPTFAVGDVADRTIEAPFDFALVDQEATEMKRSEVVESVPAVFVFNFRVNSLLESELRAAFGTARRLIAEHKQELGLPPSAPLPSEAREVIRTELRRLLPRFVQNSVLDICFRNSFNSALENQMVTLLREAMRYPGVVLSRDLLLYYQNRGIMLRNTATGSSEYLSDWTLIRDLSQARDALRQNEFELTAVSGQDKRQIIAFLDGWVQHNVDYDENETESLIREAVAAMDPVLTQVKRGRTIIRAGDEITPRQLSQLEIISQKREAPRVVGRFAGTLVIVLFFAFAIWFYMLRHQKRHKKIHNHFLLTGFIILVTLIVTKAVIALGDLIAANMWTDALQNPGNYYLLAPVVAGAILAVLLLDINLAILVAVSYSVFSGLLTGGVAFPIYALTGSMAAIFLFDRYRERSAVIRAGFILGGINVVVALSLQLLFLGIEFGWVVFLIRSFCAFFSALFAAMLVSVLLPILESVFEVTTDFKLLELSNLNQPILRRMALEAPGTYHHSIIVGTLAEAAAEAIGANTLLARVGAYYHDIGKLRKPEYYIENQIYCGNKHESLSPSMSSLILASHVKDGLAMAEELNLPPKVIDLIPQHHGTRLMTFFYQKAKDSAEVKGREVNENDYRYPGPKPQSRMAAIMMLADQVEAAARTLHDPTPGQIRGMIRRLVQGTLHDGQFDECDITVKDLDRIATAFERVIAGMNHHRIEYPGYEFNRPFQSESPEHQRIQ